MNLHYSVIIQWSDEDKAYLVILPEFDSQPQTHGETYEEAVTNAQEVLELLIESYQECGWELPTPKTYQSSIPV
jgi:antitoxin HicB